MRALFPAIALLLSGCGGAGGTLGEPAAPTSVTGAEVDDGPAPTARTTLSSEVLPSMTATGRLKAATPLLQRPTAGSVILATLPAGETVKLLGTLDNADGHWQSIGIGETLGWVRADQIGP